MNRMTAKTEASKHNSSWQRTSIVRTSTMIVEGSIGMVTYKHNRDRLAGNGTYQEPTEDGQEVPSLDHRCRYLLD